MSCLDESKNAGVTTGIKNNKENQQQEFSPVHLHRNTHVLSRDALKTDGYSSVQSCLVERLSSPLGSFQPSHNSLGIQSGLNNRHPISNSSVHNPGLVLVSTTLSSVSISDIDISTTPDCLSALANWEDVALIPASQDDESLQQEDDPNHKTSLTVEEKMDLNESHTMNLGSKSVADATLNLELPKSVVYQSPSTTIYNISIAPNKFLDTSAFKLPTAKASAASIDVLNGTPFRLSSKAHKRKPSSPKSVPPAKKPPFIVYEDKGATPSTSQLVRRLGSYRVPSGVLNSSVNLNQPLKAAETGRVTPPLCRCGRRARRLNVSNGGPNHGKAFYSCPVGKQAGNRKGCGYFIWEHTLQKEKLTLPTSSALGLPGPGHSFSSSGNSEKKTLVLRPSMRT
nr:ERI1 exoribonuclease 2-like [Podarcis muralis]